MMSDEKRMIDVPVKSPVHTSIPFDMYVVSVRGEVSNHKRNSARLITGTSMNYNSSVLSDSSFRTHHSSFLSASSFIIPIKMGVRNMDLERLCASFDFTGRTIVISGGAGVLGSEMGCALVRSGANVVILDRDLSRADPLQRRLDQGPGCGSLVKADVLRKESLLEAKASIQERFGKVYGLINAAGGNFPQATTGPELCFFDLPDEAVRQVVDLNLVGTILTSQVFGRMMAEAGEGVILNISSMAAFRPLTRTVAYSASKAAVSNFTHWLSVHMASEYSPRIRVNAIAPGFFHTNQNHYLLYDQSGGLTPRGNTILEHTPMKRFGNPDDLLGAIFWLFSPGAEFVTGAVIPVDGGFSAYSGV